MHKSDWRSWREVTKEETLLFQLQAAQSTDDLIRIGQCWAASEVIGAWGKLTSEEQGRLWGYSKGNADAKCP